MNRSNGGVVSVILFIILFAAYLTHLCYCFGQAAWGFLVAGAIFFPVGIFHGFYLWFS